MLAISNSFKYYFFDGFTDMRKGFDSLAGIVLSHMGCFTLEHCIFIFTNKKRNQIKLLLWEGDGFSIYYKRLERGAFEVPKKNSNDNFSISAVQLQLILNGIKLSEVKYKTRFSLKNK